MKKILIGTHNRGKFKEIAHLISKKYKKISPVSLKIKSPKETGKTFVSNSKLKANFFSKYVNYPVISDDSGLCIQALKGKPGIHSARLAKKHGSFFQAMKFILKKLKKKKIRKATFVCSLSYKDKDKIINVEGRLKGKISTKIIGKNGFGYDPIFIPFNEKITFGQMSKKKKIRMDHRFIAFKKLKKKIRIL
ncbi:RdgB/HAM1 family non-canonical purine NTP pyrophosphatase [Candidatus Pelagibacter bacterium]|jgi:XTP/dITP diphosphohydrolase|nr:RdgB/HAM1 family non-canonical purine NTP pyrophosphatase [Candidatus Pelagibacter bacterium]|tara:strand:+ start:908 stop:1483 length:576 start_codon:yes stop_codon:yes gene_type:complete